MDNDCDKEWTIVSKGDGIEPVLYKMRKYVAKSYVVIDKCNRIYKTSVNLMSVTSKIIWMNYYINRYAPLKHNVTVNMLIVSIIISYLCICYIQRKI